MGTYSTTWKYIRRSPYQAFAAILTMFLTFLLGGFFFLTTATSMLALSYFESKPQITVFFADKVGKPEADALKQSLEQTGKVISVTYVSKEDALVLYKEQNKNDPLLLEMVTADILPASLEVSAVDPKFLGDLEPIIKQSQGVEEVVYQKDVVDALLRWTNAIRIFGGTLAVLLGFDSVLIIMTVISMKIAMRKDEIEILKLVGASPWYIRTPFLIEGMLYGWVGSLLSSFVLILLLVWFRSFLLSFLGVIPSVSQFLMQPLSVSSLSAIAGFMAIQTTLGIFLGTIGSIVSVGRFLKI